MPGSIPTGSSPGQRGRSSRRRFASRWHRRPRRQRYVEFGAGREQDGFWHLTLVLQLASWEPKLSGPTRHRDDQGTGLDLNVVRELVMDLAFELEVAPSRERRELAEGDFVDLDLFVAAVESDANFQTAMAAECIGSLVYEQEL